MRRMVILPFQEFFRWDKKPNRAIKYDYIKESSKIMF